jgi:hypothetical protein
MLPYIGPKDRFGVVQWLLLVPRDLRTAKKKKVKKSRRPRGPLDRAPHTPGQKDK